MIAYLLYYIVALLIFKGRNRKSLYISADSMYTTSNRKITYVRKEFVMTEMTRPVRRRKRKKQRSSPGVYRLLIILIILFGVLFLGNRVYELWQIHKDMEQTLQQKEKLLTENQTLEARKETLNQPEEVAKLARERFGLAMPGEIPYKRK